MVEHVSDYIEAAPPQAQEKLRRLRALLREVAPGASESLKWGAPVFEDRRILFSYKAHRHHINFMPTGPAMEPFREEWLNESHSDCTSLLAVENEIARFRSA